MAHLKRDLVKRYPKISRRSVPPLKINSRDDLKRLLSRHGPEGSLMNFLRLEMQNCLLLLLEVLYKLHNRQLQIIFLKIIGIREFFSMIYPLTEQMLSTTLLGRQGSPLFNSS